MRTSSIILSAEVSCCTPLRRFTVFQPRLKSLERREDFFLGGGRDLVTAHATSSGSGTNVTGEPHQSAPQRFDYCQKRQQGEENRRVRKEPEFSIRRRRSRAAGEVTDESGCPLTERRNCCCTTHPTR